MLFRSNFSIVKKLANPCFALLVCFRRLSASLVFPFWKNSQTRAPHFLSAFADRLLVNGAGKTNAASQRLFFHCTCYILAHVIWLFHKKGMNKYQFFINKPYWQWKLRVLWFFYQSKGAIGSGQIAPFFIFKNAEKLLLTVFLQRELLYLY